MIPHCDNCKRFVPEWEKLKYIDEIQNRKVKFAYVDINVQENKDIIL